MKSPYLVDSNRLSDVIAAIQAMATYKFYKLDFAGWSDRISGSEDNPEHWKDVFESHPEFFRLDSARQKASLVLRRQHPKRFNVDTREIISHEKYLEIRGSSDRLSRSPLGKDEILNLIETAIKLHTRALEYRRDRRWWIPLVSSFIGAVVGSLLSSIFG